MTVYTLCHGGLGNRLHCLNTSLAISKLLDTNLVVCWPVTHECGIEFRDVFDTDIEEIQTEDIRPVHGYVRIGQIPEHIIDYPQFKDEDPILLVPLTTSDRFMKSFRTVDVYFSDHKDRPLSAMKEFLETFRFKAEHVRRANEFVEANNPCATLHIRGTDVPFVQTELDLLKTTEIQHMILQRGKIVGNLFVCSDEKKYEDDLASYYHHSVVRQDKTYPSKRDDSLPFLTDKGEYNIRRTSHDVAEAIIDMLIMARTSQIYGSTYSSLARFAYFIYRYNNPEHTWAFYDHIQHV